MPFVSQAQRSYMYANHPSIAKRWEAVTPKDQGLPKKLGQKHPVNPSSESHETWAKGQQKLPRPPGHQRDFAGLRPSHVARHKPQAASEAEAMSEGQGTTFQHGSRHTELGTPERLTGFRKRDVFSATKRLPGVPNP